MAESASYLLDTGILLMLARQGPTGQQVSADYALLSSTEVPFVSFVSRAEVQVIAAYNGWGTPRLDQLSFLLASFGQIPINAPGILDAYVAIDVYCRRAGFKMGKNDLWIAATASATGATLLTTDKDFDPLDPAFLTRVWIDPMAAATQAPPQ